MNEQKPTPVEQVPSRPAEQESVVEQARQFAETEGERCGEAIQARASEEKTRPGLLKRITTSAKARIAMTAAAGAMAAMLGGPASVEAGEQKQKKQGSGMTERTILAGGLAGLAAKFGGASTEEAVRYGAEAALEHRRIEKEHQAYEEQRRAERANQQAYEASSAMQNARYELEQVNNRLPEWRRKLEQAKYEALKIAAGDPKAREVRTIMKKRTGIKLALWEAAYNGDDAAVERLAAEDAQLEESLLDHLTTKDAKDMGDLFVIAIIPGEVNLMEQGMRKANLEQAMGVAGAAMRDALIRAEEHAERAQRAYGAANMRLPGSW